MKPNPVEYGVGKAGIQQMARYLAVHYGPRGVRCNSISPGPFPNPLIQSEQPAFIERLSQKVPLGRVGQASEIAGAVAFCSASRSSLHHRSKHRRGWRLDRLVNPSSFFS